MNPYAPTLTDAQFAALPLSERLPLTAAYYCDVAKVHEDAPHVNRGETIDAWAHELGYQYGLPWCGICVTTMARLSGYTGPIPSGPAGTHNWASWGHSTGRALPKGAAARRGDIFVLLLSSTEGHMGIATAADADPNTIEGNTNTDGSRDGWEMARHHRYLVATEKIVIIRLTDAPAPAPTIVASVSGKPVAASLLQDGAQPTAMLGLRSLGDEGILRITELAPGLAKVLVGSMANSLPLMIVGGVGYVPAKSVAQALDRSIVWNNAQKTVTIG